MANKLFKSNADALALKDPDTGNVHYVGNFAGNFATNMPGITLASGDTYSDASTGKTYDYLGASIGEYLPAGTVNHTLRHDGTDWVSTAALQVATGATGTVTAAGNVVVGGTGTITTTNGSITAAGAAVSITSQGSGGLVSGTASVQGKVTLNDGSGNTVLLKGAAAETVNVGSGSNNGIIGNLADPTTANQASNKQYTDAEDAFLRTFTGKTAAGSENPTYSNTNYVTQSVSLEAAIGELDGDVFSAISALSSGVSWKGVAAANLSALTIRDDIGGTHTLATTNDLTSALGSLSTARPWFSTSDDAVLKGTFTAPNGGDITSGRRVIQNVSSLSLVEIGNTLNDVGGTLIASGATVVNKGVATHVLLFSSESGAWFGKTSVTATGLTANIVAVSHTNGFMYLNSVVDTGYTPSSTITSNGPGAVTATGSTLGASAMNVIEASAAHTGTSSGSTTIESLDMTQVSVDFNMASHTVPVNAIQIANNHYVIHSTNGLFKVISNIFTAQTTPALADTYGVLKDLVQSPDIQENGSIYTMGASAWIKIGEFAVGQIQDGSTANTLPTWNSTDATWKQNDGLTLIGSAILGTAATALSLTAANNQEINLNASGATGHITIMSAAGDTYVSGVTSAAIGIDGIDANLAFSSAGAAQLRAQTGQNSLLRADANRTVMYNSTTTDVQTTGSPITAGSSPIVDTNFIREKVVMRKTGTTSVALTTGVPAAKFLVSVIGNTAAERYASEIMATSTNATTGVDSVEYSIVSGTTPAALSIVATAASGNVILTVTQTAGTIVVEAIPLV